uniref:Uncharacterized protein n=1 Tax=Zea mays TaxID=4577 RepID=C0P389_MAIZE|nr:unknown [Zea mays]
MSATSLSRLAYERPPGRVARRPVCCHSPTRRCISIPFSPPSGAASPFPSLRPSPLGSSPPPPPAERPGRSPWPRPTPRTCTGCWSAAPRRRASTASAPRRIGSPWSSSTRSASGTRPPPRASAPPLVGTSLPGVRGWFQHRRRLPCDRRRGW